MAEHNSRLYGVLVKGEAIGHPLMCLKVTTRQVQQRQTGNASDDNDSQCLHKKFSEVVEKAAMTISMPQFGAIN